MLDFFVVVPSLAVFAAAFAERMTPPYEYEDARSPAETSVLNNVRMAYFNNDQLPIPNFTSAEGGVAHVYHHAARDVGIVGDVIAAPYSGSVDLRDESEELCGEFHSPLMILEEDSDFRLRAYRLIVSELAPFLEEWEADQLQIDFPEGNAVVLAYGIDVSESDEKLERAYQEYLAEMRANPDQA